MLSLDVFTMDVKPKSILNFGFWILDFELKSTSNVISRCFHYGRENIYDGF